MSTTISDLDLGTEIWLEENTTEVPYILVRKDMYGCVLLRAQAALAKRMNATNDATYENSEMDQYLSNSETGFLSRFSADTLSLLVTRSVSTYAYGAPDVSYISRSCYLLSYGELYKSVPTTLEPDTSIVPALMIYKGASSPDTSRIATGDTSSGAAVNWWLRSPNSATYFWFVSANGAAGSYGNASHAGNWCRPVLNVAPATVATTSGGGKIYLIPPTNPIKTIEFKGKIVESESRPAKAIVEYNTVNLTNLNVQVTNNYGDPNPVWVDATGQTEVTLANDEKQTTNWQIGVKCYGESYGYGYFEEPLIVKYLVD